MQNNSIKIRGIKNRKQWAVFSPDGYIQYRTISDTKKEAENRTPREGSDLTWKDYAKSNFTVNKVLVDISLL